MNKLITKLERRFENVSLRTKIFFIMLGSITLICIFFLLGFSIYSKAYNRVLYNSIAGNLSFSSHTISANLKDMEKMSDVIRSSPIIQESLKYINDASEPSADSYYSNQINNQLQSNYSAYKDSGAAFISILNHRFTNSTNLVAQQKKDPLILNEALQNGVNAQGAISWTFGSAADPDIYLTRLIREIKELKFTPLGTLLVSVDMNTLIQSVNLPFQSFENSSYLLYDGNTLIYASANLGTGIVAEALAVPPNEYRIIGGKKESYFTVSTTLAEYGWRYISLVPYNTIRSSLGLTSLLITFVILLGLVLSISLSRALIGSITLHFKTLLAKMEQLSEENMDLKDSGYDYSARQDEIGHLHQRFDWMANRITHLINVNYKNQLLTKEAQIKALEAQINPHFLYNALESINWRAKSQNNTEISKIAESLGILLREMLRNKESLVTLSYELSLVHSYMTIQKIRFEERLLFELQKEAGLDDLLLPPLTIQPLLENAIRYGVEESVGPCRILVRIAKKEQQAMIEVMNEGSAFLDDLMAKLKNQTVTPHGFGIGLTNIDQRLKLLFGGQAGLYLENRDDYAAATIIIPLPKEEEPDETINRR